MPEGRPGTLLGVDLDDVSWFRSQTRAVAPGSLAAEPFRVPQDAANALLSSVVRLVADLRVGSTPEVVWQQPPHELLIHTGRTSLRISSGLVRVHVVVDCDQLDGPLTLQVPLALGTVRRPAGLVMSTFTELDGPAAVVSTWSDAVTAFAWESLVELCRQLAAQAGRDERGRALIPGKVAATADRELEIHPMARHRRTLDVTP